MYCTKGSRRTLTLTCLGVMTERPDLPYREDVLVENGAAAPKSCLLSLEMRTTTAAGGLAVAYLPPAKSLQQQIPPSTSHLSSALLDRGDKFKGEIFMAFSSIRLVRQQFSETACCPLLPEGIETNSCQKVIEKKTMQDRRSIQAVFKVVSAPAHFWDRGARCIVGGSC